MSPVACSMGYGHPEAGEVCWWNGFTATLRKITITKILCQPTKAKNDFINDLNDFCLEIKSSESNHGT